MNRISQQGFLLQEAFLADTHKGKYGKRFKSEQDAQEVMYYAETGTWKSKTSEELEKNKEFIRGFPELLIQIPTNQELFSDEELKVLLTLAQKALE